MSEIEKAIVRTCIFFDMLDYPLTSFELWKNLLTLHEIPECSLPRVWDVLASSEVLRTYIERRDGFISLIGRESSIDTRQERTVWADQKYQIAKKIIRMLARCPFVRMICVCNTVGMGAAKEESDIDLFIAARSGHLWLARLLCTGYVHFLRKRPRAGHMRNALCLSFYASDDALDFSQIAEGVVGSVPDIYFLYWISWCVPVFDDGVYEDFFLANEWVKRYLPNRLAYLPISLRRVRLSTVERSLKVCAELFVRCFGSLFEKIVRKVQIAIMPKRITDQDGRGTGVMIRNSVLKFHVRDRRKEIREEFMRRCAARGI